MDTPTVIAICSLVGSLGAAFMSYRSAAQANKISNKKVDADAYERSRMFYEKLLADSDRQLDKLRTQADRMQDQLERVNEQLASEKETSNALKEQIFRLQRRVAELERS